MSVYILGIETSCDDTSAAISKDHTILANVIAGQEIHKKYGGVVPEFASRAHQQNIIPVIENILSEAKITKNQLHAVAVTRGPGLLGSLLVGVSFAKSFALGLGIPIIEVDHLKAHVLTHFIKEKNNTVPEFPFLCLTASGGHTQIVRVDDYDQMEIIGKTIDDAAGETFDKAAKIMGLPYPGGPVINQLAKKGNPEAFSFPEPVISGLDFSFSGLKTSILYFIRDNLKTDGSFIEKNKNDLCASIQKTIINILIKKLIQGSEQTGIKQIAIAGGVSANSELRHSLKQLGKNLQWNIFIPKLEYTTDNAAMIAISGYFKYLKNDFAGQHISPYARQL